MIDQTPDLSGLSRGANELAAGVSQAAGSVVQMADYQKKQDQSVDIARAEAYKTAGFLNMDQSFKDDPNYQTFTPRADQMSQDVLAKGADLIRDPQTRTEWLARSESDRARAVYGITAQADTLQKSTEKATYATSMDSYSKIAADPTRSPEDRAHANTAMGTMLWSGLHTRLLTPEEGYQWKKSYIEGSAQQLAENYALSDINVSPAAVIHGLGVPTGPAGNELINAQLGASGGVLPMDIGVARQVATTLGDHSFPQDDASAKAYLNDPKINAKYAAQATSMLTQRYKGDMTAAVIASAPGGGTKMADQWVASHHDESKLTEPVRQYYRTVMSTFAPQTGNVDLPIAAKNVDLSTISPPVLDRFGKLQSVFGQQLTVVQPSEAAPGIDVKRPDAGQSTSSGAVSNGLTVDVSHLSEEDRSRLVTTASALGFGGVGIYKDTMHLDAGSPAAWGPDGTPNSIPAGQADAAGTHVATGSVDIPPNPQAVNPRYAALPFDKRLQLYDKAKTAQDQGKATARASLAIAEQNAPAAFQASGEYSGYMPTANDFVAAYGGVEGIDHWNAFNASVDTAHTMFAFKSMPADQIASAVNHAMPTSTGDLAADQLKSFQTISTAAKGILEQREKDPAQYVISAFPNVRTAWAGVGDDPTTISNAIALTASAEAQLGITKVALLPKDMAHNIAATYLNPELPADQRIGAITHTIGLVTDQAQQRAIYNQLVDENLPPHTIGAMAAWQRGDQAAAQNLFRAAMVDPAKLPGEMPVGQKPTDVKVAVQQNLFDNNGIAGVRYGQAYGSPENYIRMQNDGTLLNNSVTLHLMDGSAGGSMDKAVSMASKELFGDIKVMKTTGQPGLNQGSAGVLATIPASEDPSQLQPGFTGLRSRVKDAIDAIVAPALAKASTATGERAVLEAAHGNRTLDILTEGFFADYGDGRYTFVDPKTALAIPGSDGKPLSFSLDDVKAAAAAKKQAGAGRTVGGGGGF